MVSEPIQLILTPGSPGWSRSSSRSTRVPRSRKSREGWSGSAPAPHVTLAGTRAGWSRRDGAARRWWRFPGSPASAPSARKCSPPQESRWPPCRFGRRYTPPAGRWPWKDEERGRDELSQGKGAWFILSHDARTLIRSRMLTFHPWLAQWAIATPVLFLQQKDRSKQKRRSIRATKSVCCVLCRMAAGAAAGKVIRKIISTARAPSAIGPYKSVAMHMYVWPCTTEYSCIYTWEIRLWAE